jgi:hypothetical protein
MSMAVTTSLRGGWPDGGAGGLGVGRGVAGAAAGEEEAAVHAQPAGYRGVAVQHRVRLVSCD